MNAKIAVKIAQGHDIAALKVTVLAGGETDVEVITPEDFWIDWHSDNHGWA